LEADAGIALRRSKGLLKNELGRLGLSLKGFEVRGGRLAEKGLGTRPLAACDPGWI